MRFGWGKKKKWGRREVYMVVCGRFHERWWVEGIGDVGSERVKNVSYTAEWRCERINI